MPSVGTAHAPCLPRPSRLLPMLATLAALACAELVFCRCHPGGQHAQSSGETVTPFGRSRVHPRPAQFRSRDEALSFQVRYMLSLY